MVLDRAYAVLEVKAVDAATRTIRGIASTPTPDRHGDILEPTGATFANPLPLLLHHDKTRPVGTAILSTTEDALTFTATLPAIEEKGALRDRVDEAWHSITAGLIRGVSIGFRVLEDGLKVLKTGGLHFLKTEVVEVSLVTIPANVDATILAVKSYDLAASGRTPSGVADPLPVVRVKVAPAMTQTVQEQIKAFETSRAAKVARMGALMDTAAAAGVTLDADQTEEYDGLAGEVKAIDDHLVRARAMERLNVAAATAVPATGTALVTKAVNPIVQVRSPLPKGTAFTRVAMAILAARGDRYAAIEHSKQWDDSTPEVGLYLKAAVAPGTTTDPAWAGNLVPAVQAIAAEFLELLRPATILGKLPNLRTVPFNASVPVQTAGGAYGWVGQNKPKPVTKLGFGLAKLDMSKASGIIVLTEELVRTSNPSAEAVCRADMIAGIAAFLDTQFIDPAVAAVTNVNPASITNGLTPVVGTGKPVEDVQLLLGTLAAANIPLGGVVIIMSETNALALGFARDALGNRLFPTVGVTGGTIEGVTVVTSNTAGTNMIALQPSTVLYADDGGVSIDVSREASVQMDSAPMVPDATTVLVSLWQNNLIGLRAERFINWKRGRDEAVAYMASVNYMPTPP